MPRTTVLLILTIALLASPTRTAAAQGPDDSLYAGLLARHVAAGVVDYAGLKAEEAVLDRYLDGLAATDPDTLPGQAAKAYYINAYNAWTLKLILEHYPGVKSIKDIGGLFGSPWKIAIVNLPGRSVTLDYLEHEVLRPRYKDPRVHMAINCASKGCPPLRAEPYAAERLDAQLDDAGRRFINDPRYTRLEGETLFVSSIFDWFGGDFGGEKGVLAFVTRYAADGLANGLAVLKAPPRLAYLDYDWSLNGS